MNVPVVLVIQMLNALMYLEAFLVLVPMATLEMDSLVKGRTIQVLILKIKYLLMILII